ncbi:extracellular solute-binding protein [Vibrio nigripulchritudo ATCC 27043]|uniref:ABC transporter substrate-binding protein n=1 Tax=Vibrio nigripulchritudo TaxID=28173 RepID=UPI00021C1B8D|nr:sugar ABC transporter substrate-binding protein [Vibrio nigripulchritudo]EGU60504.1 extracellular solute-binding protein [Vibrio nigripulchritudo ATCC 27043]
MKRLTTHLHTLCAAVSFGLMVSAPAAMAEDITIRFWDNQQTESGLSEYQKASVALFEKENPGIKVEVTTVPYPEYQQRLLTAVRSGNAPDISTVDQIWLAAFAEAGAIIPLDNKMQSASMKAEQFFPGAWSSVRYKDKTWGVPFNVDVWQFSYVNNALFKSAGIAPESIVTWSGLKNAAKALTDKSKGQYGVGLFGHKGEDTVVVVNSFIFSNGGQVLDKSGQCKLNEQPAVEALAYLQDLAQYAPKGILNASSGDMRELFLNGSLAIEFWPALEQPTLQKSNIDWDFFNGHAPKGKKAVGTYGGWNLVVYRGSKHQEAAWKFAQFLTRQDINGKVVDLLPANVQAAQAFVGENRSKPYVIIEHLNNASPRPLSARYLEVADIQMAMIQDLFDGTPAQKAADAACIKINQL